MADQTDTPPVTPPDPTPEPDPYPDVTAKESRWRDLGADLRDKVADETTKTAIAADAVASRDAATKAKVAAQAAYEQARKDLIAAIANASTNG